MTRLLTTGAEEREPEAVWNYIKYIRDYKTTGLFLLNGYAPGYGVSFAPRTGNGMYLLTGDSILRQDFGTGTKTELFWGFAMRVRTLATMPFLYGYTDDPSVYTNYLGLRLATTGAVELLRSGTLVIASDAGVISAGTWHYFEVWMKPLNTNGRAVVYVDGVKVIDYTGDTTNEEEFFNAWALSGVEETLDLVPTAFDDIVCNDSAGSVNNTYPGMVRLLPIRPVAAGTHADWARGGVDLGTDVGQVRNGTFEFTMLQTANADKLVTFDPDVPNLPAGATITNIVLSVRAKVEAGAGVIAPMLISNGTESISADQTLLSSWRYHQYAWSVNPYDSAAWEEADLALLEIGASS